MNRTECVQGHFTLVKLNNTSRTPLKERLVDSGETLLIFEQINTDHMLE